MKSQATFVRGPEVRRRVHSHPVHPNCQTDNFLRPAEKDIFLGRFLIEKDIFFMISEKHIFLIQNVCFYFIFKPRGAEPPYTPVALLVWAGYRVLGTEGGRAPILPCGFAGVG